MWQNDYGRDQTGRRSLYGSRDWIRLREKQIMRHRFPQSFSPILLRQKRGRRDKISSLRAIGGAIMTTSHTPQTINDADYEKCSGEASREFQSGQIHFSEWNRRHSAAVRKYFDTLAAMPAAALAKAKGK
jgi:hypothetical protein